MADVAVKNKKSANESAHKTGAFIPNNGGINFNAVNPGATTGAKASTVKFNTMKVPLAGTNLQVTVDAGKEIVLENVSSIEAIAVVSAMETINETDDKPVEDNAVLSNGVLFIKEEFTKVIDGVTYLDIEALNGAIDDNNILWLTCA